jgi:hypothetical protein
MTGRPNPGYIPGWIHEWAAERGITPGVAEHLIVRASSLVADAEDRGEHPFTLARIWHDATGGARP